MHGESHGEPDGSHGGPGGVYQVTELAIDTPARMSWPFQWARVNPANDKYGATQMSHQIDRLTKINLFLLKTRPFFAVTSKFDGRDVWHGIC